MDKLREKDLHIHTVISGDSDLTYEKVKELYSEGGVGFCEHSCSYHNPHYHKERIKPPTGFYLGIEADYIARKGELAIPKEIKLDYVTASLHDISDCGVHYFMPRGFFNFKTKMFGIDKMIDQCVRDHIEMTRQSPDIIAHPFFILWLQGIKIPEKKLTEFFEKRDDGPAIEINSKALSRAPENILPNIFLFYRLAKENDSIFSYGSDAHEEEQLEPGPLCFKIMEKLNISPSDLFMPD